jgi:TP901 family phage tail tape measure protein
VSDTLNVRATFTATNELSPAIRRILSDIKKLESVSKNSSASFSNVGRAAMESMASFDRTIKAASSQLQGLSNVSRSAARNYASDWHRANAQRLSNARQMYQTLERLEAGYQRQLERRIATERRSFGAVRSPGSIGRLPAPSVRSIVVGGSVAGAGVASALKKRIEVEAAEVRAQMFGDLTKEEVASLRKGYADRAGIKYGVGSTKVIDTAVEGLKAGIAKRFAGEFADLALKAQAGLDVNPQDVGKLLGRLSTQMPWDRGRFSKILNSVAVANNATAADGNEIIEAMRRSLSALATTKMSPEQLAAIDSTAISLGIQPFKAGSFTSFLTSQVAGADSAHGQQAKDLSSAANALGFGGRGAMAKAMRDRPMEAIQQILDNLAKMPEKLRTKVAKQIGGRQWMDELLTLVLGRDKLKDVLRDIESKPGFLDKTALQKIRSMQGRWASIVAALGLVGEKVGAGFEDWFNQISDSIISLADTFNFDSIKQHVGALVDGLREGFGLKDWGEAVKSLADNFDAGTVAKWREFGRGFAEGIREFANGLKTAFSALGFLAGKNPTDAGEIGNLVAKLTGLTVALAVLSPLLSVLTALTVGLTGLGNALAIIGGMPAAVALLSLFAARNQDVGVADDKIRRSDPKTGRRESYKDWQDRIETKKRLRSLAPSGDPLFQPTSFTSLVDQLGNNMRKLGGKIERAAIGGQITDFSSNNRGGLQNASYISGGGGVSGNRIFANAPALTNSTPGQLLPNFSVSNSGIIRRDRIPSFSGGGGSMADGLNRSAFERKFGGTALAGEYDQIVSAAKANGIPPSLLAGIIAHETGNGLVLSGNNPGGLMDPATGSSRKMRFGTLDAGINATARTVSRHYKRAGGDIKKMGSIYAPPGAANDPRGLNGGWPRGVKRHMSDLAEEPEGARQITGDYSGIIGGANYMRGQYGPAGSNLTTITLDSGKKITVHKEAAESYRGFFNKLEADGYKIDSIAGYNYRNIRGSSRLSQHAYGNAVDVNPSRNPMSGKLVTDLPPDISQRAAEFGLAWGGDWKGRKDAMHFEYMGRRPWLEKKTGVVNSVPTPADVVKSVPRPEVIRGDASLGVGGGSRANVAIHINGNSHDPEALATLVQRRIDESMNWRTHDSESEYT